MQLFLLSLPHGNGPARPIPSIPFVAVCLLMVVEESPARLANCHLYFACFVLPSNEKLEFN